MVFQWETKGFQSSGIRTEKSRHGEAKPSICGLTPNSFSELEELRVKQKGTGFPGGSGSKESASNAGDPGDMGSVPGWGRSPWRREWLPTPVFLPGKSHGQRSLAGYTVHGGHKESDTVELPTLTGKNSFIALPGNIGHSKLMPSKPCPNLDRGFIVTVQKGCTSSWTFFWLVDGEVSGSQKHQPSHSNVFGVSVL